jgi:Zn-dependent alcohol dehydrogenase
MRGRAQAVRDRAMHVRARLLAALVLAVVAASVLAPSAGAQATSGSGAALVTARVAPMLGVFVAGDGSVGIARTVDATVRRERLGRTLIVTVIPVI